eukprot:g2497.t1
MATTPSDLDYQSLYDFYDHAQLVLSAVDVSASIAVTITVIAVTSDFMLEFNKWKINGNTLYLSTTWCCGVDACNTRHRIRRQNITCISSKQNIKLFTLLVAIAFLVWVIVDIVYNGFSDFTWIPLGCFAPCIFNFCFWAMTRVITIRTAGTSFTSKCDAGDLDVLLRWYDGDEQPRAIAQMAAGDNVSSSSHQALDISGYKYNASQSSIPNSYPIASVVSPPVAQVYQPLVRPVTSTSPILPGAVADLYKPMAGPVAAKATPRLENGSDAEQTIEQSTLILDQSHVGVDSSQQVRVGDADVALGALLVEVC